MIENFFQRFKNLNKACFDQLELQDEVFLYAGNLGAHTLASPIPFIGLSINRADHRHIRHDIREKLPVSDNSVKIFQSEDVFEHVQYSCVLPIINEIYRILIPGGLFRLSVPDYRCDILSNRCIKDDDGNPIFDPGGGGSYQNGVVVNGGHLWFPTIESIRTVMKQSDFSQGGTINYLHYYDQNSISVTNQIDHLMGTVIRTPDFDTRVQNPSRAMSIVLDAYKA